MALEKKYLKAVDAPNTGEILKKFLKDKRINKSALARVMGRKINTLYAYGKNKSIQSTILWELSHALKHNFFADIAAQLPNTYTQQNFEATPTAQRIAQLEQENLLLTHERDVLMKVLSNK